MKTATPAYDNLSSTWTRLHRFGHLQSMAGWDQAPPATVSGIAAELIEENLVFEKEQGDSSGGRPPIMLAINPHRGCVVGIKVMEDHALGALTDLEAAPLGKQSYPLKDTSPEGVSRTLGELVKELLKKMKKPATNLMGVGVGLAGIVDSGQGLVRQSPFFGWNDIPLRELIQNRVKVPVYLDNMSIH